jgi:hypothetical protein
VSCSFNLSLYFLCYLHNRLELNPVLTFRVCACFDDFLAKYWEIFNFLSAISCFLQSFFPSPMCPFLMMFVKQDNFRFSYYSCSTPLITNVTRQVFWDETITIDGKGWKKLNISDIVGLLIVSISSSVAVPYSISSNQVDFFLLFWFHVSRF